MTTGSEHIFEIAVGEKIASRYEVIKHVNVGGMAEIYLVIDQLNSEVPIALKLLSSNVLTEASVERLSREVELIKPFDHPNIVKVYELGRTDSGRPYITMEYIDGVSLFELIHSKVDFKVPVHEAIPLLIAIADALAYAHDRSILHRDLKPENILLNSSNVPKLADFGCVYSTQSNRRLTAPGTAIGTPGYIAPEQLAGKPLDSGVDIFAFGVLAFEMLTGKQPTVVESSVATLLQNQNVRLGDHSTPLWFRDLVLTCTELDRKKRFGSMREIIEILKHQNSKLTSIIAETPSGEVDTILTRIKTIIMKVVGL